MTQRKIQQEETMKHLAIALASLGAIALAAPPAGAQDFPAKPIRIVVPFAAGGATDTTARIIGEGITKVTGQPVVVENKPGGLGIIAIEEMAKANPDGYTLMMGSGMVNGAVVATHPDKFSIDYDKAVASVGRVADVPAVYVVTTKNFNVSNIDELRKFAKANPGKVRVCNTGPGTALHIEATIFEKKEGIQLMHVPYPTGQTAPDLINGDLHFCSLNIIQARPMVKAGQIKPIIVTTEKRLPDFPDTPTMAEIGHPELNANYWGAVYAPSATPKQVLEKINAIIAQAQQLPEVKQKFESNQMIPVISPSLDDAKTWNAGEVDRWRKNFANSGIKLQ
jgi:tripartite-type tricarboxylate transporter receptor subunit TctC